MNKVEDNFLRIVILMEYASENGIEYIKELERIGIIFFCIIVIGHEYPKKREQLLYERTGGKYTRSNFSHIMSNNLVPIYMVDDVNGDACFNLIKQISPDVVVFEGSRIIKSPIFDLPNIGMLNVHSAILPYLRGCSCLEWSILNNYPVGVTCHFIIAKVDAGPIVKRVQLHYDKNDTYYDIRAKIIYLTAFAMGKAVKEVIKKGDIGINIEEKGLWYSPIKDKEKLLNVCTIISEHKYIPKIINDNLPLIEADVNLKTGKVSRIK